MVNLPTAHIVFLQMFNISASPVSICRYVSVVYREIGLPIVTYNNFYKLNAYTSSFHTVHHLTWIISCSSWHEFLHSCNCWAADHVTRRWALWHKGGGQFCISMTGLLWDLWCAIPTYMHDWCMNCSELCPCWPQPSVTSSAYVIPPSLTQILHLNSRWSHLRQFEHVMAKVFLFHLRTFSFIIK